MNQLFPCVFVMPWQVNIYKEIIATDVPLAGKTEMPRDAALGRQLATIRDALTSQLNCAPLFATEGWWQLFGSCPRRVGSLHRFVQSLPAHKTVVMKVMIDIVFVSRIAKCFVCRIPVSLSHR